MNFSLTETCSEAKWPKRKVTIPKVRSIQRHHMSAGMVKLTVSEGSTASQLQSEVTLERNAEAAAEEVGAKIAG